MKKLIKIILFLLISGLTPANLAAAPPAPAKASWLIRRHIASPEKVKKICRAAGNNFTQLLVQARGRADSWYKSDFAPRAEELQDQPTDFDPLGEVIKACEPTPVQAWLNIFYLWTGDTPPESANHPALKTKWILRDNNGKSVADYSELERRMGWIEGIYADPADPEYRLLMAEIVRELLNRYDLAGIHLDFIRYPGSRYGFAGITAEKFKKQWGFAPAWLPEKIEPDKLQDWLDGSMNRAERILTTGALIWAEMRAAEVSKMVETIRRAMKQTHPGLLLSAAVDPDRLSAYLDKGQDWQAWAEKGLVDELYPMTYFGDFERIGKQLGRIRAMPAMAKVKLWAGLGAYIKDSQKIGREAALAGQLGYPGISLFSLGHILRKDEGCQAYIQAIDNGGFTAPKLRKTDSSDRPQTGEIKLLDLLNRRHPDQTNPALTRLNEYIRAAKTIIPRIMSRLQKTPQIIPAWLELGGIFRFVHPLDSLQKQEEQRQLSAKARRLLKKGKKIEIISRCYSQAGTRKMGGRLPLLYFGADKKLNELFKLQPGEISRIIRRPNGYWCYQLKRNNPPEVRDLEQIPWPARRIIFKRALGDFL